MSGYGWIATREYNGVKCKGTMGPGSITPEMEARLLAGEGETFRVLDDDREVYFHGRLIGGDGFEPLDDYGMPGLGATMIEYKNPTTGQWEVL